MYSKSKSMIDLRPLTFLVGGLFAITLLASPGFSADTAKICAKADQRYAEMFPDAKEEPGIVVVKMYKYTFCPPKLTVPKNTVVRFVNVDRRTSHSVWFKEAGQDESGRMFPEEFVDIPFPEPGQYNYLCGPHWESDDMKAQLTVTAD